MMFGSETVIVPTITEHFQWLVDSREVYILQCKQMVGVNWVQEAILLHVIEKVVVYRCHTSMHITPQPFDPLIVDRATNYDTSAISPSVENHVPSNSNFLSSLITAKT